MGGASMFGDFIIRLREWATHELFIESIVLVGSYARGTQNSGSDIDLILVTSQKQFYIENTDVFSFYNNIQKTNIEFYGECTSIRVWYENGLEVEYGMVTQKWVEIPLEAGTMQVLSDGYKVLIDKKDSFLPVTPIIPES